MGYYVEYIFMENFFIDFILLYITGNLIKSKIILRRLVAASVIGGLYVIAVFYFSKVFLTGVLVKVSISILMLIVAYDNCGLLANIRAILCFYIVSLTIVGIISAIYYFTYNRLTADVIVISLFIGFAVLKYMFHEMKIRKEKNNFMRTVKIEINNHSKSFKAFVDTGNELSDPISGKPVIVVNMKCISSMIGIDETEWIKEFYMNNDKNNDYIKDFSSDNHDLRFRVVSYSTISDKRSLMLCIVPDSIIVIGSDGKEIIADAIIGIYPKIISKNKDYDALLFKKFLDWESEIVHADYKTC